MKLTAMRKMTSVFVMMTVLHIGTTGSWNVDAAQYAGETDSFMNFSYTVEPTEFSGGYWCDATDIGFIATKDRQSNLEAGSVVYNVVFYEADWNNTVSGKIIYYQGYDYGITVNGTIASPNLKWTPGAGIVEIGDNAFHPSDQITAPLHGKYRKIAEYAPISQAQLYTVAASLETPSDAVVRIEQSLGFDNRAKMFTDRITVFQQNSEAAYAQVYLNDYSIRDAAQWHGTTESNVSMQQFQSMPYDNSLSITYSCLPETQKRYVMALYNALQNGIDRVDVPSGLDKDTLYWLNDIVYNEFPELCAFDSGNTRLYTVNDAPCYMKPAYRDTIENQKQFLAQAQAIIQGMPADLGDMDKVRWIHDMLCSRFEYDYDFDQTVGTTSDPSFAYSCLRTNMAVCNGYAQTFVLLCHLAGVECSWVNGITYGPAGSVSHAWNIVGIGGQYALVDVTWDDISQNLENFCISSAQMYRERTPHERLGQILPEAYGMV